jgi:O-antigen/teichoic acid export membrane protein
MLVVLVSLAAGVVLLLVGLGNIAHVGEIVSTVSIGISLGLLLFSFTYFAFGRKRRSVSRRPRTPEGAVSGGKDGP